MADLQKAFITPLTERVFSAIRHVSLEMLGNHLGSRAFLGAFFQVIGDAPDDGTFAREMFRFRRHK